MNSTNVWRLLREGAATGAHNMAADETLLESAAQNGTATLRFYRWNPHCLSLGRLQKTLPPAVIDAARDFDVVRRPTGGRAVWHAHEITYALAMPLSQLPPDARGVNGAYRWLSEGFLSGLRELGVPVEMAAAGVRTNGPNCFAASASCDFLVDGKKLIGAAQFRRDEALLQHGSLLLSIDRAVWESRAAGSMSEAIALADLGIRVDDVETIIEKLCAGFERASGTRLEQGQLSPSENARAAQLQREKYERDEWTFGFSQRD